LIFALSASGEQLKNGQVSAKPWKDTGGRPCRASGGRPGCSYLASLLSRCQFIFGNVLGIARWLGREEPHLNHMVERVSRKTARKMPVREVLATKLGSSIRRVCAGRGGAGDLCIRLVKCHFFGKIPAYRSPRFWVDLIQRQTGKLR
jgi:hypothetical protein